MPGSCSEYSRALRYSSTSGEGRRPATDDRECHRQAEGTGSDDRIRRAANSDPDGQRLAFLAGIDRGVVQRRPELSAPGHGLAVAQGEQQIKLLVKSSS